MKPSHLTTPRTMNEACFHTSGEAVEFPPKGVDPDRIVARACIGALVLFLSLYLTGALQ